MTHTANFNGAAFMTSHGALAAYALACTSNDPAHYREAAHALAEVVRTFKAPVVAGDSAKPARRAPSARRKALTPAETILVALKAVMGIVERRNTIPILSNVRLVCDGERLTIEGTDLDMMAEQTIDAFGLPVMDITVDAQAFAAALRGAKGDFAYEDKSVAGEPEIDPETGEQAVVTHGKNEYPQWIKPPRPAAGFTIAGADVTLATLPARDFPVMAESDFDASFIMPAADFAKALSNVSSSMSTEETRYYLSGAFLHVVHIQGQPILRLVACDGHRLTLQDMPGVVVEGEAKGVIIPRKAVLWIAKHATSGDVLVEINEKRIKVTTDAGSFITKTVDGSFPDYNRVIPTDIEREARIELDCAAAATVIKRLVGQVQDKGNSVRLIIADGQVMAQVRTLDATAVNAEIPALAVSGEREIGFNGSYLLDMLALGGRVTLRIGDSASPMRVEFADDPNRVGVVMPKRV